MLAGRKKMKRKGKRKREIRAGRNVALIEGNEAFFAPTVRSLPPRLSFALECRPANLGGCTGRAVRASARSIN